MGSFDLQPAGQSTGENLDLPMAAEVGGEAVLWVCALNLWDLKLSSVKVKIASNCGTLSSYCREVLGLGGKNHISGDQK